MNIKYDTNITVNNMNKKDVINIMGAIVSDSYFREFVVRKSDASIIRKLPFGFMRVIPRYYNTYDLVRDDLALEITPFYEIRFNVLHKWIEKYSKRALQYQRDDYSIAFWGDKLGTTNEFFFLENREDFEIDFQKLYIDIVRNAKHVFSKYSSLDSYYDYCINDVLNGKRQFPDEGFEWVIEHLIATRIVAPSNYERVKEHVLQRVDWMMDRGNPNMELYYNDLPMILGDLESTDFLSGKWGVLPN